MKESQNAILNIIIPVLNEEKRLQNGIQKAICFLRAEKIPHILSIVDNGSTDSTPQLAKTLCENLNAEISPVFSHIEYLRLEEKGVGLALRCAIHHNATRSEPCAFIGYMDLDLSTDLYHLKEVYENLCNGVEIIVGSRLLRDSQVIGRSLRREILSRCSDDKSWFYCAQMLIIAQYQGLSITEIAVKWEDEVTESKVKIFSLSRIYLREIWRLYKLLRINKE